MFIYSITLFQLSVYQFIYRSIILTRVDVYKHFTIVQSWSSVRYVYCDRGLNKFWKMHIPSLQNRYEAWGKEERKHFSPADHQI